MATQTVTESRIRRKLHPDLVPRAKQLAALGLPLAVIAQALGVHRDTLRRWRSEAEPGSTEHALSAAIQEGQTEGEMALVNVILKAAQDGDTRSAQWLLTHAPAWRDNWSDAAAERRLQLALLTVVVEAIAASRLPADLEQSVLLNLQARGLGTEPIAALVEAAG